MSSRQLNTCIIWHMEWLTFVELQMKLWHNMSQLISFQPCWLIQGISMVFIHVCMYTYTHTISMPSFPMQSFHSFDQINVLPKYVPLLCIHVLWIARKYVTHNYTITSMDAPENVSNLAADWNHHFNFNITFNI